MQCPQCSESCYPDETDRQRCESCGWYEGHAIDAVIDAERETETERE